MSDHHTYKAETKKLPDTGEVEIKSSIPADEFASAVKDTLESLRRELEVPGFRKGAAPEKIVREKVGTAALLREAAEHAISHAYGHILEAEGIDAIGYPKVSITKIAEGNPLDFTIVTAVVPEIHGFDYKSIAKEHNAKKAEKAEVTDAEIEKALEDIKKNYPKYAEDPQFKDEKEFKERLRKDLGAEKEHRALEKRRLELVDALTSKLDTIVPDVLVETELARMTEQMRHDIERMGLKFEDYLKHLKKSASDLHKEWRPDALKRAKLELILAYIAREEKISADKALVEAELAHVLEHHKDVDASKARSYFEQIFLNQAVFEFLEKQK